MRFYLTETARLNGVQPLRAPGPGDAGYDIRSNQDMVIHPGEMVVVPTGLHVAIPEGMVGVLKDRSSMARAGLHITGGVIDASYRGQILVVMENRGLDPYDIHINDRIVQMLVVPCYTEATQGVDALDDLGATGRGAGGFGSTGRT